MSANVAYVWTNISWIYLLYSCILVNRMNKSVICIYKGTHACSIFTACLMIMSTCRIFMLSCQILLSELWQHSKYIYVTVIFPTVNNQIRFFFLQFSHFLLVKIISYLKIVCRNLKTCSMIVSLTGKTYPYIVNVCEIIQCFPYYDPF